MDRVASTRMQIRAVLTVFRSELRRLRRRYAADGSRIRLDRLRVRSLELLDKAREDLGGDASAHPDLVRELESARQEIAARNVAPDHGQVGRGAPVSVDWRGDRPG